MKMILRISQSLSVNLLPEGLTEYFRDILNFFCMSLINTLTCQKFENLKERRLRADKLVNFYELKELKIFSRQRQRRGLTQK